MERRIFLDITERFDNIVFVETHAFMHFWTDEKGNRQSRVGETYTKKFGTNAYGELKMYLSIEHARGNTVYFYGEPYVLYNPSTFEPNVTIRMNSYEGRLNIEFEEITKTNTKNYKYLLI